MRDSSSRSDLILLKDKFRILLRAKLLEKYSCIPTAKKFASDFNNASGFHFVISDETSRKWISGVAIPSGPRMQTLTKWLGFSLDGALVLTPTEN